MAFTDLCSVDYGTFYAQVKNLNFGLCPAVTSCSYSLIAPAILSLSLSYFAVFSFSVLYCFLLSLSLSLSSVYGYYLVYIEVTNLKLYIQTHYY